MIERAGAAAPAGFLERGAMTGNSLLIVVHASSPNTRWLRDAADVRTRCAVETIAAGLGLRPVKAPLIFRGAFRKDSFERSSDLGLAMAAGLEAVIF